MLIKKLLLTDNYEAVIIKQKKKQRNRMMDPREFIAAIPQ